MRNLLRELEKMEFVNETICMEEGYLLVHNVLKRLYNGGNYEFLRNTTSFEDLLDDIFEICIRRDLFNRFQLSQDFIDGKTENNGKRTYIKVAVKRMLIDLNAYRRTKVTISADKEVDGDDDNSENLYNTLADNVNVQDEVTARLDVMQVINTLDDTKGTAVGVSPLLGESKLNEKTVLLHVLEGYNVTEIAAMYKNPTTGKPVAKTYVSRLIKNCRQYF